MWSEDGGTSPLELRTTADWVVRQRLLTIDGVSQVITMGGGRKQYHVLVDLHKMHQFDVSMEEVETALGQSNLNVTGGFMSRDSREFLIRGLGRFKTVEQIQSTVVRDTGDRPILVAQIATVKEAAQTKRGDSSINGKPAVVLTVQKQPDADTRAVTQDIHAAIEELRASLPDGVVIDSTYEQREFIDHSVANVVEALRDGAILVVIVLFVFLFNFRTTFITLTAIPLSILVTALVFRWFGLSINVMTLGGLAVAMGELVDDAIVDVENIFRRLKQNRQLEKPRPVLSVIFDASVEVRNAIIVSTILVVIVFAPLFALSGMEGRLFAPLGIAYIVFHRCVDVSFDHRYARFVLLSATEGESDGKGNRRTCPAKLEGHDDAGDSLQHDGSRPYDNALFARYSVYLQRASRGFLGKRLLAAV